QSMRSSAGDDPIRIHQRRTLSSGGTSVRACPRAGPCAQAGNNNKISDAQSVRNTSSLGAPWMLLGRGSTRGRALRPAERRVDLVGRRVRLVGQRLIEPLLVVGLDALHVRHDGGLRRRVLHLLDLVAEL